MSWFYDDYVISNKNKISVPWLGNQLNDFWFEIEEGKKWFTKNQESAFDDFLLFSPSFKLVFHNRLKEFLLEKMKENYIETINLPGDLNEIFVWKETLGCIPAHYDSKDKYVFLLPELEIKILPEKDCNFELEIVIKNGEVFLIQEMRGLWMIEEWFTEFLKIRRTI